MIKVTYDNGYGYTACLYETLPEAMEDIDDRKEKQNWTVYEIQEVLL